MPDYKKMIEILTYKFDIGVDECYGIVIEDYDNKELCLTANLTKEEKQLFRECLNDCRKGCDKQ